MQEEEEEKEEEEEWLGWDVLGGCPPAGCPSVSLSSSFVQSQGQEYQKCCALDIKN